MDSAQNFADAMETWSALSSTGLVEQLTGFAEILGKWAEAAAKLIGLVA